MRIGITPNSTTVLSRPASVAIWRRYDELEGAGIRLTYAHPRDYDYEARTDRSSFCAA